MKTENYPSWLVPIEQAKRLKEIGFDSLEIFVDKSDSWYKGDEIFYIYVDGELETYFVKELYLNGDKDFIPTYIYEQVFEWFREKKIYGNINQEWEYGRYNSPRGLNYFYVINDCRKKDINKTEAIINSGFNNYEEAREALVNKLIEVYGNNTNI